MLFVHQCASGGAVDFRCGDVHEEFDRLRISQHRIGDNLRSEHVSLEELAIVEDRTGYVRFGGKMHNDGGLSNERIDQIGVENVSVPELEARVFLAAIGQICDAACICKGIEHQDPIVGI